MRSKIGQSLSVHRPPVCPGRSSQRVSLWLTPRRPVTVRPAAVAVRRPRRWSTSKRSARRSTASTIASASPGSRCSRSSCTRGWSFALATTNQGSEARSITGGRSCLDAVSSSNTAEGMSTCPYSMGRSWRRPIRARFRTGDVSEMTIKTVPAGAEPEHPRGILLRRNGSESGGPPRELETQAGSFPRGGSPGRALGAPAGQHQRQFLL